MICHYWFFNHGFKFKDSAFDGCHDLTILSLNISKITIITVKYVDCHCIIHNISKSAAISLLKNLCLKLVGIYKNVYPKIQYQKSIMQLSF